MEKQITITLTERNARVLVDCLYTQMQELDALYEKNQIPRTKLSADIIEEIRNDVMEQLFKD